MSTLPDFRFLDFGVTFLGLWLAVDIGYRRGLSNWANVDDRRPDEPDLNNNSPAK